MQHVPRSERTPPPSSPRLWHDVPQSRRHKPRVADAPVLLTASNCLFPRIAPRSNASNLRTWALRGSLHAHFAWRAHRAWRTLGGRPRCVSRGVPLAEQKDKDLMRGQSSEKICWRSLGPSWANARQTPLVRLPRTPPQGSRLNHKAPWAHVFASRALVCPFFERFHCLLRQLDTMDRESRIPALPGCHSRRPGCRVSVACCDGLNYKASRAFCTISSSHLAEPTPFKPYVPSERSTLLHSCPPWRQR